MSSLNIKLSGTVNSMGNPNTIRPGALLRKLREQQNLTVEEISEKTLISLGKLKLLEEDRYNDVGIDLFVCGYIKKYAYTVGADSDQLIAGFKSLNNVSTDDALNTDTAADGAALKNSVADDTKITDKPNVKIDARNEKIIYTGDKINLLSKMPMLLVVVALAAIWGAISFFMQDSAPQDMDAPNDTATETLSDEVDVIKGAALVIDDPADRVVDSAFTDSVAADSFDTIAVEQPLSEREDAPSPVNDELVVSNDGNEPGTGAVPNIEPSSDVENVTMPALSNEPKSVVSAPQNDLVFSFSDDCWISVKDANGESLFAQLQRSGDNLQLSGIAPFDVQLGNARVATLRVNDEPFSIPVKSGRKTSRFTVTP